MTPHPQHHLLPACRPPSLPAGGRQGAPAHLVRAVRQRVPQDVRELPAPVQGRQGQDPRRRAAALQGEQVPPRHQELHASGEDQGEDGGREGGRETTQGEGENRNGTLAWANGYSCSVGLLGGFVFVVMFFCTRLAKAFSVQEAARGDFRHITSNLTGSGGGGRVIGRERM